MMKLSCGTIVILGILNFFLGGLLTQYVLNYWLSQIKGHTMDVPFLICGVIGLVFGEVALPAAIITFIIANYVK